MGGGASLEEGLACLPSYLREEWRTVIKACVVLAWACGCGCHWLAGEVCEGRVHVKDVCLWGLCLRAWRDVKSPPRPLAPSRFTTPQRHRPLCGSTQPAAKPSPRRLH